MADLLAAFDHLFGVRHAFAATADDLTAAASAIGRAGDVADPSVAHALRLVQAAWAAAAHTLADDADVLRRHVSWTADAMRTADEQLGAWVQEVTDARP